MGSGGSEKRCRSRRWGRQRESGVRGIVGASNKGQARRGSKLR